MNFTTQKKSTSLTEKRKSALNSLRAVIALAILFVSVPVSAFALTATFYGDAGGSSLGSDGSISSGFESSIVNVHNVTTGDGQQSGATTMIVRALHNGSGYYLNRAWLGFDISSLISTTTPKVIDSVTLTLTKNSANYINDSTSAIDIIEFNSTEVNPPASEFGEFGFTPLPPFTDSPIPFADFGSDVPEVINLNASAITFMSSFSQGGYIRFGLTTNWDMNTDSFANGDDNLIRFYTADNGTFVPVLTVTYHLGNAGTTTPAENNPLASSTLIDFTYLNSSTTQGITSGCDTFDFGCYIINGLAYVFVPSSDSVSQFRNLSLASSSPFSYAYDMGNVYTQLFNYSTTSVLDFTLPFSFAGHSSSTITLLSHEMLTSTTTSPVLAPIVSVIRNLLVILLWFSLAQFLYREIMQSHNKEVKV